MDNYNQNTGSFSTPQGTYDPVTGAYNPAPTPDAPPSTYDPVTGSYTAPPAAPTPDYSTPGYGAPAPDYSQPSYTNPPTGDYTGQPSYTTPPAADYTSQQSPYGQPASPYGQPASPYGQPQQTSYGQPASPYGQPQYNAYSGEPVPGRGKAIAGLVLGIFGLVGGFIPYLSFLCLPASIVGLILSIQARKQMPAGQNGLATAGLITSAIGLGIAAIGTICTVAICVAALNSADYSTYSALLPLLAGLL